MGKRALISEPRWFYVALGLFLSVQRLARTANPGFAYGELVACESSIVPGP